MKITAPLLSSMLLMSPLALAGPCSTKVLRFIMYSSDEGNPDGSEPFATITEGAKIMERNVKVNIEAVVDGDPTCSHKVELELEDLAKRSDPVIKTMTENFFPFFLYGDDTNGFVFGETIPQGDYMVSAIVDGDSSASLSTKFSVRKECTNDQHCNDNYDCTVDTCGSNICEYEYPGSGKAAGCDPVDETSCVSVNGILVRGSYDSDEEVNCYSVPSSMDCPNVAVATGFLAEAVAGAVEGDSCNHAVANGDKLLAIASHGTGNEAQAYVFGTGAFARNGDYNTALVTGVFGDATAENGDYNYASADGRCATSIAGNGDNNIATVLGDSTEATAGVGDHNVASVVCPFCSTDSCPSDGVAATRASASGNRNTAIARAQPCDVTIAGGSEMEKYCLS